ncbi:MAG TPA: hypothetical protein VNA66_12145, partial [Gammaproteobacteria bacterium]|nr:hypothetical protein [Gammaproteobacteria bacterium]
VRVAYSPPKTQVRRRTRRCSRDTVHAVGVRDKLRNLSKRRGVRYGASLPERVVRSASALAAGTVREVAAVALPIGLRRGRLYRNLVDVTLQFLAEDVGGVASSQPTELELGQDFLLRRAAGNGIELMGVIAFRASPVWVLAALADVAGFGRQLIPEIAEALKKEGLLEPDDSFATMEQLLGGLERSSAQLAESVNAPPLDIAGLRNEWRKFADEARQLPAPQLPTASTVTRLWQDLRATAEREQRSLFEVSSLLAVAAVGELPERARVLSKSAAVVLRHGGAAVSNALLEHYRESLRQLREVGYLRYGVLKLTPYTRAALGAFHPERETLTGKLLDLL